MPDPTDPLAGTTGVAAPTNPVSMQPPSPIQLDPASVPALGGDNLGPYTPQPAPVSSVDAPQLTDTIPSETAPNNPDIERNYHEATWRRILDRVGTILGGDQTIHMHKDTDGNITVTHDPSTGGEKWGRIAAAALGGAAKGLANSQGPGGLAKAAGAGVEYGMNIPKQEQENVDAQATAEQKRMEANANMAKLHQDAYLGMMRNNTLQVAMDEKSAQLTNDYVEKLKSSPDAKDYGPISGPDDLMRITSENADFLKHHTGLVMSAVPVSNGKGGTSLHAVAVDPGDDERMTSATDQRFYIANDASGKPVLKAEPMGGARMKNRELRLANQGVQTQYMDQLGKWGTLQKNLRDPAEKVPASYQQAYGMAANTNDPAEKKKYNALGDDLFSKATRLKETTTIKNILPSNPNSVANWGELLSDPKSGVTLANVPVKERGTVINAMATAGQKIAKPLTGAELNRSDLAGNALSNIEEAQRIMEKRPNMFGPAGFMSTKFKQAFEGGDPDAQAFMTAITLAQLPLVGIHGVRGKYAVEDLAKLDSNLYNNVDSMRNILSEIHRSAQEFADSGGRKKETATPAPGGTPPPTPAPAAAGGQQQPNTPQPVTYKPLDVLPSADGKSHIQLINNVWTPVALVNGQWKPIPQPPK